MKTPSRTLILCKSGCCRPWISFVPEHESFVTRFCRQSVPGLGQLNVFLWQMSFRHHPCPDVLQFTVTLSASHSHELITRCSVWIMQWHDIILLFVFVKWQLLSVAGQPLQFCYEEWTGMGLLSAVHVFVFQRTLQVNILILAFTVIVKSIVVKL
jgi:hypothetical protein